MSLIHNSGELEAMDAGNLRTTGLNDKNKSFMENSLSFHPIVSQTVSDADL